MSVEADLQAAFCATLVDEWVRAGLTDAVVCPGSRSTPLALALAARPELRLHVRLDERSAGFFAVGLGLATGRPAVLLTTSGTAAAELHPSVAEAHHARVPLLACTADRPPELQDVGAPQTIDQVHLFGPAVRWFCAPGVPVAATSGTWRSLADRAVAEATAGPAGPGPVHLNLAFREPLVGEPGALPPARPGGRSTRPSLPSRPSGPSLPSAPPRPSGPALPPGPAGAEVDGRVARWSGRRGLVVAGARSGPPAAVLHLAERLGWPVLADPRSGCRVSHPQVVAAADGLLRSAAARRALRPEVVVRLGDPWASKVLSGFLSEAAAEVGTEIVAVDPWWRRVDPDRLVTESVLADPAAWVATLAGGDWGPPRPGWLARWQAAEEAAQAATDRLLLPGPLTEPGLARHLFGLVPAEARVVVSSSMPVRDLEWYAPPVARPPEVLANRGVNGIDGVTSTALGVAAAGGGPVVAVLGDLAFLHDVSALVQLGRSAVDGSCTVVVVDNGGGGIFSFLPQATTVDADRFEQLFGTPAATDVGAVARGFGIPTVEVATTQHLADALAATVGNAGLAVVRAQVPGRADNVALHDRVHEAVCSAVDAALG
ncbi:MAG TPA: 2-succinyl-5-enolpyruvyl-6-hydroxy-3-cyclohexene-1-carboxylic-acid synthase [Acidimicrobiales bacterium]|nr:2-succinyl-5-enolpyruvyl-6-hydroxy-3-cyclohexene-1-carboxylic-acid synthase [Acidimicrobiales bacterium]